MAQTVTEVMTSNPLTMSQDASIAEAARMMRDRGVGDILVTDGESICGIVTDRDIVVRAIASGSGTNTRLGDVCSHDLATLRATDTIDDAISLMRQHHIRRLPVVEGSQLLGVVSLGDLALERDPNSVLGEVSSAPPNT